MELKSTGIPLFDAIAECETQTKLRSQVEYLEHRVAKLERMLDKKIKKFERKEAKQWK